MLDYSTYFKDSPYTGYRVVDLGKVYLASGRVYCCDPFLSDEVTALEKAVPAGHFNVKLSIVTLPDWGRRVALAGLILSNQNLVSWQKATYMISGDHYSEFRVDAGLACFMDKETRELFIQAVDDFYRNKPEGNYYDDILAAEFKQNAESGNPHDYGDWDVHYPAKGNPGNIVMFASGLGDGIYSAYWGLDEMEQPVMLVADFGLLP